MFPFWNSYPVISKHDLLFGIQNILLSSCSVTVYPQFVLVNTPLTTCSRRLKFQFSQAFTDTDEQ